MNARKLARLVAVQVAKGQYDLAVESAQTALDAARNDAESRLAELEDEVAKLRKSLAYNYTPTQDAWNSWYDHNAEIDAAGGTPPDEEEWRVELALAEMGK